MAVENAFDLWQKASRKLNPAYQALLAKVNATVKATLDDAVSEALKKEQGDLPARWPATRDDFLKLVVQAKTPADAAKRFRDFLGDRERQSFVPQRFVSGEDTPEAKAEFEERKQKQEAELNRFLKEHLSHFEDKAVARMEKYGQRGIDRSEWPTLRGEYLQWWADRKSDKARASAKEKRKRTRSL